MLPGFRKRGMVMKLTICIKFALAFALIGSAAAATISFSKAEQTVVARAGDPSQWG